MRIVFWQNMIAFHQVRHITALAMQPDVEVVWVVEETLAPERIALGWSVPNVEGVQVVVAPDTDTIQNLVSERTADSIHIFTGIHQDPVARKAFYLCTKTSAKMGLLVETPFPGILRDLISPVLHRVHRLIYGKHISFIMAMGHMAADFYTSVGYPASMVFPYGYFPPKPTSPPTEAAADGPVQIMYLGQLIRRKGVDILLKSLGTLTHLDWFLTIVGSGDQKDTLVAQAKELGLENRVRFQDSLENQLAMELMEQSDLFVLPSRHDGWGVVVNEALMRGVPVICSDRCGALDLLGEPWRGGSFRAGSAASLASVLRSWISRGKRSRHEAGRIRTWSRCIEGDVAADYLLKAIRASLFQDPRPIPPWQASSQDAARDLALVSH